MSHILLLYNELCGLIFFKSESPVKKLDTIFTQKDVRLTFQICAPLAQLDRASDYGSEGWGFESLRACC